MGIDRPVGAQHGKARDHLQRVPQPVHRAAAQVLVAEPVARLAVLQEAAVAGQVAAADARHLGLHRGVVLAGGEGFAIGEQDAVERVHRHQRHVAVEVAPAGGPKIAQALRHGDDGGAQVKAVAALRDRRPAPAGPVQPVQDGDLPTLGPQPHGRGKAAKPGADDDGLTAGRRMAGGGVVRHERDHRPSSQVYNLALNPKNRPICIFPFSSLSVTSNLHIVRRTRHFRRHA